MQSALLAAPGQARMVRHRPDAPRSLCCFIHAASAPQLSTSRLPGRQRQRCVRVCAAGSLYEVLGVPQSASERDIKRAYRQKALKLHPDVNKAPNAEAQFLAVKGAFSVLSDPTQRAAYDRQLRFGGGGFGDFGGWGSSTAGSGGGYGAAPGGSRPRPKQQQQEEFYGLGDFLSDVGSGVGSVAAELGRVQAGAGELLQGVAQKAGDAIQSGKLEDFFNDLGKEYDEWSKKRSKTGEPASLWEELSAIGEEFVDFLEAGLSDEYRPGSSKGKEGSAEGGSASFNSGSGSASSGGSSRPKSPVDAYEQLKRRYDLFDEATNKARSSSSSSGGSSSARASSSSGSGTGAGSSSGSSSSGSSSAGRQAPPPPPKKTRNEEVEDELAALKKRLGRQ